jgi:hypothetical protein
MRDWVRSWGPLDTADGDPEDADSGREVFHSRKPYTLIVMTVGPINPASPTTPMDISAANVPRTASSTGSPPRTGHDGRVSTERVDSGGAMPGRPLGAKECEETRRGLAEGCAFWNWLASKRPTSTVSREISGRSPKSCSGVTASHRPAMRPDAIKLDRARPFSPARGAPCHHERRLSRALQGTGSRSLTERQAG